MGTELLEQYDEQRERVRVAEEAEAKAKAVYDKAKDARKAAEAELHLLRSRLERAISGAGSGDGDEHSDAQGDSPPSGPKPVEPTTAYQTAFRTSPWLLSIIPTRWGLASVAEGRRLSTKGPSSRSGRRRSRRRGRRPEGAVA